MKLLIVDDNPEIRRMLKQILSLKFNEIHEIDDGKYALETYSRIQPDYVLMDIKMKHVDGLSATRNILNKYPEAKILIISHFNDKDIINSSLLTGAIKFLSKDNLSELLDFFN